MSETKPKKMVGRSVAVALGAICIVLVVVGLVGAVAYVMPTLNDKDNTISSLNLSISQSNTNNTNLQNQNNQLQAWLDGNKTLLNQTEIWLDDNITYYNSQISSLNSQVANLQNQKNQLQTWLSDNITDYETRISSLNTQINRLQTWLNGNITSYTSQINSLNSQISNLQNQISSLNAQITNLQSQIADLQAPKLIKVNLKSDDNRPFLGTYYLHVYGEVCNVGSNIAYNCKIHVTAYQSGGVVAIDTDIILGTIGGESWVSVDGSPTYSGTSLTSWTITLQWTSS
jgi:septal ring factor EnvC (AmiA/AmiB activator)